MGKETRESVGKQIAEMEDFLVFMEERIQEVKDDGGSEKLIAELEHDQSINKLRYQILKGKYKRMGE